MPYQIVKYREPKNVVPDFLYVGEGAIEPSFTIWSPVETGGVKPFIHIGFAIPGAVGDFEVMASKEILAAYFAKNIPNLEKTLSDGTQVPFDPVAEADAVWVKLEALNK